jgi:hypothetical protein
MFSQRSLRDRTRFATGTGRAGIMLSATGDDESQSAAQFLSGVLKETLPAIFFDWHPLSDPDAPRIGVYVGERPTASRNQATCERWSTVPATVASERSRGDRPRSMAAIWIGCHGLQ